MGRNSDCRKGNLLDYECFSKHCWLIAIDLSKQVELKNHDLKSGLILLVGLIEMIEQQCSLPSKNQKKPLLNSYKVLQPSFNSVQCYTPYKMETQKIVNLLNISDNESSEFAIKSGALSTINKVHTMVKVMLMLQALYLRQND